MRVCVCVCVCGNSVVCVAGIVRRPGYVLASVAVVLGLFVLALGSLLIWSSFSRCSIAPNSTTKVLCEAGTTSYLLPLVAHRILLIDTGAVMLCQLVQLAFVIANCARISRDRAQLQQLQTAASVCMCDVFFCCCSKWIHIVFRYACFVMRVSFIHVFPIMSIECSPNMPLNNPNRKRRS
jgi:hypothetical protein